MPIVEAHILKGYAPEEKKRLTSALTDAVRFVVPAAEDAITVMLHEYPLENYARGRLARDPAPVRPNPVDLVTRYLDAMEARKIETASSMLAPQFEMHFPAAPPFTTLDDLLDWAKDRYRFVQKSIEATEAFQLGNASVVYVRGTLAGEWPDGRPFANVRFVDRFEIEAGLLTRQDVWNDLAEVRGR